jgi:hypothetical protein
MTSTEAAQALSWITSTLNNDATIRGLASFDATNGIVWDGSAPRNTLRPFFIVQVMPGGQNIRTANERKRFAAGLIVLLKAVGEARQFATLDTMAAQADFLLSPKPDGNNQFPIQLASGAWILSCVQTANYEQPYIQAGKQYADLGGLWAVRVKVK